MNGVDDFQNLAIATAIGLLIGFEREWRDVAVDKERFAGARTFAVIGFAGGIAGLFGAPLLIAAGLLAVGAIVAIAYWSTARHQPNEGSTTEFAAIATYLLGALAAAGSPALAAAGGVGAAILLSLKGRFEALADRIDQKEIAAILRFLAIAVIILPILPDRGFGPYEALNPRSIWWTVVLISGLSFVGYWLGRFYGSHGVIITGLVGGLASSTATTLSLSRLVRDGTSKPGAGAAGIVAANIVMLGRVAAILAVAARDAALAIWPALLAGAIAGGAIAFFYWRTDRRAAAEITLGNPLELRSALIFAGLLAVITLGARFALDRFGSTGFYVVAAVSGLADLDALTLSAAAQTSAGALAVRAAGAGVLIAIGSNMIVKGGMTLVIAGAGAGFRVASAFALIAAVGAAAYIGAAAARLGDFSAPP
jgi:uncharacterized membrane protein (DUF4010 family)